jgi:hypothetical protein
MSDSAQESQKRHFSKIRPHVLDAACSKRFDPLAAPLDDLSYSRSPDGSSRRKAAISDRDPESRKREEKW